MGTQTYLEFGRVVAVGRGDVTVETTDVRGGTSARRRFALSNETRADLVHEGDSVEVIYTQNAAGERTLDRLIALRGSVPKIGPAPEPSTVRTATAPKGTAPTRRGATRPPLDAPLGASSPSASAPTATMAPSVAAAGSPGVLPAHAAPATSAAKRKAARLSARTATHASRGVHAAAASAPAVPPGGAPASVAAAPAAAPGMRVPPVSAVSLGGAPAVTQPVPPRATAVRQQPLGDVCDRPRDWPSTPVQLAVLDFRYPTEREEARDATQVGGGSGTVLADQVYNVLAADPHLILRRGDRQKLFRMDFAGAARIGRQMGADAVLLGTFVPVQTPNPDPDAPQQTTAYTLRAGIVETCTGELLYKLDAPAEIPARAAADPNSFDTAFAAPIEQLLAPVLAGEAGASHPGSAGTVAQVQGDSVTLRLSPGANLRAGDQVGILASRLAKIPSTNTLHVFRDELIGRVTIQRVSGGTAYGVFAGEPAPMPGDAASLLP